MRWTMPIAALLVATLAQAANTPPPGPGRYPMDADKDGFVTRDEASSFPMLAAQFDAADTNKDGRLDAAEMDAHRAMMHSTGRAKAKQRWQAADKDGDSAISLEEAQASMPGVAERFSQFDIDGDGKIERAEMREFRMQNMQKKGGASGSE